MRTTNTLKLVAAIALAMGFTSAQALPPAPVPITATVTVSNDCTIFSGGPSVSFGSYVSGQTTNLDATTNLSATCTSGTPYSIAINGGGHYAAAWAGYRALAGSVSGYLAYGLRVNNQSGAFWGDGTQGGGVYSAVGNGAAQSVIVAARIPSGQTAAGGTYTDLVNATISY
ncbi:MAG: hypothetical protein A2342_08380 [Gallionellales bacterium RIFOXYB12_FULL_54_9]|nr:MAG: hypothetical protein A2342_08380 [Gallionellales bacterium RIFOXYB12_FULL_54_9]